MDKMIVVSLALGAIGWINWYFFLSGRRSVAATAHTDGAQEVVIAVEGGYDPAEVHVRRGATVRLIFDRRERSSCSEEVVIPEFGVRRFLPPFERTVIELKPEHAGTFDFTCGMNMLRGRLVVEDA